MLGKYLLRGLRFLFSLTFDRVRQFAQSIRQEVASGPVSRRDRNGAVPTFSTTVNS